MFCCSLNTNTVFSKLFSKGHAAPDIGLSQPVVVLLKKDLKSMESKAMLRGMANVSYWADDVKEARKWYAELFGMEPYFQRPDAENPAYIEFRVGDYQHEVGIISKKYRPKLAQEGPGGAVLYWHVDDIQKTMDRLLSMGAKEFEPITKRGEGFTTASVIDPFGNVLGIMYNQHYLEILSPGKKNNLKSILRWKRITGSKLSTPRPEHNGVNGLRRIVSQRNRFV